MLLLIEIVSTISKENHILFAYRMIHVYTMHHIRTFLHGPSFLSLLDTHNILSNSNTYKIILKTMWFTCNIGGDRFPRRIIPYLALITLNNITFNMVVLTLHLNINGCTNRYEYYYHVIRTGISKMIYTYINTYIVTKTNLDFRANSKNEIRVIK